MIPHVPPHTGDLVVAAVVGAVVGGVALLLVAIKIHRRSNLTAAIVGALIGLTTFVIVIQTRAMDHLFGGYFSFKTPRERLHDHFADFEEQVARDPEIRRAFHGLAPTSQRLQELSALGVRRLDNDTLRLRARLMAVLLSRVSDRACACIVLGAPATESNREEVEQAMLRLEATFVAAYMQTLRQAMLAEARKSPVRPVTQEEMGAAYQAIEARLGPDTAGRVAAGLAQGASVAELCWAAKTLYAVAPTLPEPHGSVLLRFMAQAP